MTAEVEASTLKTEVVREGVVRTTGIKSIIPEPEPPSPPLKTEVVREGVVRTGVLKNRIPEPEAPSGPKPAKEGISSFAPAHLDERLCCRLAIDIGGTFTDAVMEEDGDELSTRFAVKVLTTHRNPADGLLDAAQRALAAGGRRPDQVRLILHGTTLATNAVLERRGACTAMLTTEGFRDVLEVGTGGRHDLFDLKLEKTRPLIPRRLCFTVRQRHSADGTELEPLDEVAVREVAGQLRAEGVDSIAICFLHSYANWRHEERAATILRTLVPGLQICTSSAVSPEIREYERFSTAAVNAYVQPLMCRYLRDAQTKLNAAGFRCPLLLMTSGGGLTDADTAAKLPVRLVESGPAGGVMLAENVAREVSADDVLSFDMGGTTAKVCMLKKGRAAVAREFEVDRAERFRKYSGLPVRIPCLDLVEICGGGGSIASTSAVGAVTVGPMSAGSDPGPACYGRGGTQPTVTDADVVLGRLDPAEFAGGEVQLKAAQARSALHAAVTEPQGLNSDELAAQAVVDVVEEAMAGAAKAHAAEHGRDLGQTALVAFGGAAPLHAARLAERLGLNKVVIPVDASVGSAIGFFSAPLKMEAVKSMPIRLDATFDPKAVNAIYRALWHETVMVVAAGCARWKPGRPAKEVRRAYGRYCGQGQEVAFELPIRDLEPQDVDLLREKFEEAYKQLYCRTIPEAPIEIRTWAQEVVADADPVVWAKERLRAEKRSASTTTDGEEMPAKRACPASTRSFFDGTLGKAIDVPIYLRKELPHGACVLGPAIIAEKYTSTVVTRRFQCEVLENGFLQLAPATSSDVFSPEARCLASNGTKDPQLASVLATASNISVQLIWKRLLANVEEQARFLIRAAFSPVVRESHALACGIFDGEGRLLALSESGTPGLAAALVGVVSRFLKRCARTDLEDGDTLLSNDPWTGTGHICDFTAVTPVFTDAGEHIGFIASAAHTTDVGGMSGCFSGIADAHAAGFCLPVSKLVQRGTVNMDILRLLRANSRCPDYCVGDVMALLACNELGVKRLNETLTEFPSISVASFSIYIRDASRDALLRRLATLLPHGGTWEHSRDVDDGSGHASMRVEAQVQVNNEGVKVHLQACRLPSSLPAGLCMPFTCTEAYARYALCSVLARDVPLNDGSMIILEINAATASPLNAEYPTPVNGRRLVALSIPDLIFGCLAQSSLPEGELPAESASALCRLDLRRTADSVRASSGPAVALHVESGGTGARLGSDGLSATAFPSGLKTTPVEVTEAAVPLMFRRKELLCDSGGAGRSRGGLGLNFEVSVAGGQNFMLLSDFGHKQRAPSGRCGGQPGSFASVKLQDGSVLPERGQSLPKNFVLSVSTAGGGGFGSPQDRPHESVLEDVRNGFVSAAAAMNIYGLKKKDLEL